MLSSQNKNKTYVLWLHVYRNNNVHHESIMSIDKNGSERKVIEAKHKDKNNSRN